MHAAGIGSPARYRLPGTSMAALKAEGVTSDHAYCTAQISRTRRSPLAFPLRTRRRARHSGSFSTRRLMVSPDSKENESPQRLSIYLQPPRVHLQLIKTSLASVLLAGLSTLERRRCQQDSLLAGLV